MVQFKEIMSKKILTAGSGFIDDFTHTLNPYAGCSFGCRYCYIRSFPISVFRDEEWGSWVDIKTNAADLLASELQKAKKKGPVHIFMSTATDPYQGIEAKQQLTRSLVEILLQEQVDFLHVQTRSPLVKRDIDLFQQFGDKVIISMTIETDIDKIRKIFSPSAPPIAARLNALKEITEAGVPTQASMTPMLPSTQNVAKVLKEVTNKVIIDNFFMGDGSRGKRTEKMGIRQIFEDINLLSWYEPDAYIQVLDLLKQEFGDNAELLLSQKGSSFQKND